MKTSSRYFFCFAIIITALITLIIRNREAPKVIKSSFKYILIWDYKNFAPQYYFGFGQEYFIKYNCSFQNCFVTDDKNFFGDNLKGFDAITFNGRFIESLNEFQLLQVNKKRYRHQKYVFLNMESAINYPVCKANFDNFFNWRVTYRLDSDIPMTYFVILNMNGEIVGPKQDMKWVINDNNNAMGNITRNLNTKTKAAAWFVSNCKSRSRFKYVEKLQTQLKKYNLSVDIYGPCGHLKCPRYQHSRCLAMLKRDYYFYMALENTITADYVTEKVLHGLQNDVVPIVRGGANYSRFLPPGSYLDSQEYSTKQLAAKMNFLMNSPLEYLEYFKWKSSYKYRDDAYKDAVCSFCEMLNNQTIIKQQSVFKHLRRWWLPNFRHKCFF
ncbi:alpha-(1,3)-fucosyltransferase C-like isoform X3 [Pectinophora gossypiella]|nr:alpha-(1,3)-fucosyltransferase C-like isoform X3 [Pectinophora gossypiella]